MPYAFPHCFERPIRNDAADLPVSKYRKWASVCIGTYLSRVGQGQIVVQPFGAVLALHLVRDPRKPGQFRSGRLKFLLRSAVIAAGTPPCMPNCNVIFDFGDSISTVALLCCVLVETWSRGEQIIAITAAWS